MIDSVIGSVNSFRCFKSLELPVPQNKRSGNLRRTETIVTAEFRGWDLMLEDFDF